VKRPGFLGVPDFNINETPQDMADFYAIRQRFDEHGLGRANGWQTGIRKPYNLKYIELGNEENREQHLLPKLSGTGPGHLGCGHERDPCGRGFFVSSGH